LYSITATEGIKLIDVLNHITVFDLIDGAV